MTKYVDCHSHLLPGVDDGSQYMEDTRNALERLHEQGFGHVILTPHIGYDGWWFSDPIAVKETWTTMMNQEWPVQLYLWGETNCRSLRRILEDAEAGTLVTLGPDRTVLLEYEPYEDLPTMVSHAAKIKAMGYDPVLAHPERIDAFRADPDYAFKALRDDGLAAQSNSYSLVLEHREDTKAAVRKALELEVVRFIGSDSHPPRRWPRLEEGIAFIREVCASDYVDDILWRNAYKMLGID